MDLDFPVVQRRLFFDTLQLRLLRGRTLSEVEVNDARKVAVVNQTLVNKFFGAEDPIGQRIKINMLEKIPDGPVAKPGIRNHRRRGGRQEQRHPGPAGPRDVTSLHGLPAHSTAAFWCARPATRWLSSYAVQREIWAVDRNVALTFTGALEDYMERFFYAGPRFGLILLGVFAGVGLVLVALGVYSVIAYTVSRQTHEIGIRMALGAGSADVLRMVMRMGMRLIVFGVVAGLAVTLSGVRVLSSQLWGVSPRDPVTLAGVTVVVALAGLAACYFPARRATRVDPLIALRYE